MRPASLSAAAARPSSTPARWPRPAAAARARSNSTLTSTGTISVASGTLLLTTGGSISGTLSGAGTLELASASTTQLGNLAAGPGGANLLSLGVLKTTGTAKIAADLVQQGGTLSLATNSVLTASGDLALLDGAIVTGLATLATSGAISVGADGSAVFLRGGMSWSNYASATLGGQILTLNATTITNGANASFALVSDAASILNDGGNSTFVNAGLLEKIGGSGTSEIDSTLNSTGTIAIDSGTLLLATGGTISGTLSGAGTLELASASTTQLGTLAAGPGGANVLSLGLLKASGPVKIAADLVQQGGTLSLITNAVLTISGNLTLLDGAIVTGLATLSTNGITSAGADGSALYLRGGMSWTNHGSVTLGGQILTLNAATITNGANASFALTSDAAGILNDGANSTFANAGLLEKTGGSGTSEIDSTLNSTGTIAINSGTLLLATGGTVSGTLAGPGTLELAAGSTTRLGNLTAPGGGSVLSLGLLTLTGKTVALAANLTQQGGTLGLLTGATLTTTSGLALTEGAIVTGLATLATLGTTSVAPDGGTVDLRGGLTWSNKGAVTVGGRILTLNTTTFSNAASGSFALAADGAGIIASGGNSSFKNAGLLSKTGGGGTSEIDSTLNSTGTIAIASGTLLLTTGATLSGVLNGAGTLELGGALNRISGLSSTSASSLLLDSGTFTNLAGSVLAGGVIASQATLLATSNDFLTGGLAQSGGTISVSNQITLTLGGPVTLLGGCAINGSGTLATTGTVTAGGDGTALSLLHTVWKNGGSVTMDLVIDCDGNAGFSNGAGAVFAFGADGGGIHVTAGKSSFANAGTLAKSGGGGTSAMDCLLTSTGTISVATGTLDLAGGGTISGAINGAGTLLFGAGIFSVAPRPRSRSARFAVAGATVSVAGALSGPALSISGGVLTLAAAGNGAASLALSAGTLVLSASTSLAISGGRQPCGRQHDRRAGHARNERHDDGGGSRRGAIARRRHRLEQCRHRHSCRHDHLRRHRGHRHQQRGRRGV